MSKKTTVLKIIIPFIVIITGILIMVTLVKSRPEPKKEARKDPGILVRVIKAEKIDREVIVKSTGTVEAAQEVSVIPQVSGRIVYVAPDLDVGGFFKTDEILFKIEDTDYRLALERAKASRAKADYDLATIESQASIARSEWERMNRDNQTPPNPLVLYKPQLKNAQAALASAEAAVKQAEIDLERTRIRVPFNSRVRSENIDLGQYVTSGQSVAVLAGTDAAEIMVPLPLDDLRWLEIPRYGKTQNGAAASVYLDMRGKKYKWKGRVVRSTGEVDTKSRMMQLVVQVDDPYGLKVKKDTSHPALALGTFVDVHLRGKMLRNVFVIPRIAFRDNSTVWIMDSNQKLLIRNVMPSRIEKEEVIISEGLENGEMIVATNISGAADGMKLRPVE